MKKNFKFMIHDIAFYFYTRTGKFISTMAHHLFKLAERMYSKAWAEDKLCRENIF